MNQNLSPLIELQKLDLRITEIKDQRRKIPERLQAVEAPLREARQLHQQTSASVETSSKNGGRTNKILKRMKRTLRK